MRIRETTPSDEKAVREIHRSAFPEQERELVSELACSLLREVSEPPTISLVAEGDDGVLGHVAFSPVIITAIGNINGYILAPLAVKPETQRCGVGSQLVQSGMERLKRAGVDLLFVYGDPGYYGRFGFEPEAAVPFLPPYTLKHPHGWQACMLADGNAPRTPQTVACVGPLSDPRFW